MAKGYKERIIDVSLKEFLNEIGIKNKSTFDKQFERFLEIYPINVKGINYFKKDPQNEATEFEFKWEWYPLFKFLYSTMHDHPFYRRQNLPKDVTAEDLVKYYGTLVAKVDDLPDYIRNEVISHRSYQNTLKEKEILPDLVNKVTEFISAMELITKQERPDIMITLYKQLDDWIYNAFINNERLNEANKRNQEIMESQIGSMCSEESGKQGKQLQQQLVAAEEDKHKHLEQEELDQFIFYLLKEVIVKRDEKAKTFFFRTSYAKTMGMADRADSVFLEQEEKIVEKIKEYEYKKQTSVEKVKQFQEQHKKLTPEEYEQLFVEAKEKRIQELHQMIEACQEELESFENTNGFLKEGRELEANLRDSYIQFDKQVKDHSKQYREATKSFLGQLVSPAFNVNK